MSGPGRPGSGGGGCGTGSCGPGKGGAGPVGAGSGDGVGSVMVSPFPYSVCRTPASSPSPRSASEIALDRLPRSAGTEDGQHRLAERILDASRNMPNSRAKRPSGSVLPVRLDALRLRLHAHDSSTTFMQPSSPLRYVSYICGTSARGRQACAGKSTPNGSPSAFEQQQDLRPRSPRSPAP